MIYCRCTIRIITKIVGYINLITTFFRSNNQMFSGSIQFEIISLLIVYKPDGINRMIIVRVMDDILAKILTKKVSIGTITAIQSIMTGITD